MFENVGDAAFIIQLVVAFGAGVISFISPCVLPLLPGYLSMMSGYSAAQLEEGTVSNRRMLRVILLFILGFTLVFAALGAGATAVSDLLRQNLSTLTRIAGVRPHEFIENAGRALERPGPRMGRASGRLVPPAL